MGMESIALILCMTAAAVLALLLGRLLSLLLKIAIVIGLVYFALTRTDFSKWEMCKAPSDTQNFAARALCR